MIAAGGLQLARGAEALEVTVEPDFQKQARGKGRAALGGRGQGKTQGGQVELLDELAQEARRMIGRDGLGHI